MYRAVRARLPWSPLEKQRFRITALGLGNLPLAGPKVVQVVLSPWVEPSIATNFKNCVEEKGASRSAQGRRQEEGNNPIVIPKLLAGMAGEEAESRHCLLN